MPDFAELRIGDKTVRLPIVVGTEGERAIDISKLRDETGLHHPRPGLRQHRLVPERDHLHRRREGDPALPRLPDRGAGREELVPRGRLPADRRASSRRSRQLKAFTSSITYHTMLHEDFKRFYGALPKDAHPMAACVAAVAALATFYPDSLDPRDQRQVEISVHRLIAKMPTLASYAYKHSIGQPFIYPDNRLELRRQLPAADVRHALRGVRRRRGGREGDRPAADPPRRPRAELLHQHRAAGRLARW